MKTFLFLALLVRLRKLLCVGIVVALLALAGTAEAQEAPQGIAWYGTWKQGAAAARTQDRPILLVAAAPHCHNISGMW